MAMGSSSLIFFMISFVLIHLVKISIAQLNYLFHTCSNSGNYTSSTYQTNLNTLLASYSDPSNDNNYGFYNSYSGQDDNRVFAMALCRGDLSVDLCRSLVNGSSHDLIQRCPYQKEAIGWYDGVMLRYSNHSITFSLTFADNIMYNTQNVPNVVQFNLVL